MKISVIVPVRNREKYIGSCIESLLEQNIDRNLYEIIIVDNASFDQTARVIHSYPVKYLYAERLSISAARNLGIRNSLGEYVAFVDSDAVADQNWLRELMKGFDHSRIAGCGGKIFLLDKKNKKEQVFSFRHKEHINGRRLIFPTIICVNAIFHKSLIIEIGLFDDKSLLELRCEDVDLSWRLHLAGYQFKYIDSAVVYHRAYFDMREVFKKGYQQGQSNIILERKYHFINNLYERKMNVLTDTIKMFLLSFRQQRLSNNLLLRTINTFLFIFAHFLGCIVFIIKEKKFPLSYELFKQQVIAFTEKRSFGIIEIQGRTLKISKGTIWAGAKNKIRIANIISGDRFLLNKTGSFIWNQILDSKPKDEIVSSLEKVYEGEPFRIEEDLNGFIQKLQEFGFLKFLEKT